MNSGITLILMTWVLSHLMSNSDSSRDHLAIQPIIVLLWRIRLSGKEVTTMIECAWKKCMSSREAIRTPRRTFRMSRYLVVTPCNRELTKYTGHCTDFFLQDVHCFCSLDADDSGWSGFGSSVKVPSCSRSDTSPTYL